MESILGFNQHLLDVGGVEDRSTSFKLVPWISWDEWKFVKESLFSSSPNLIASAIQRISTWRSRGCIPVAVELTGSIVEIQQNDPFFRNALDESALQSEEMLAMLYCMAIMRLVNGVVEKNRKKNEISIGEAADIIGIPRMLIDIRHEGSHRDLPSLQLVRLASGKALDWLVSYYWEPQENEIPAQSNQTANTKREIKHRLHEVAHCLKVKQMAASSPSNVKGKRVRQAEHLHGRSKFMFLASGRSSDSSSTSLKKQLAKSLKHTLRLYSSFSEDVINILLEYLLNALESSNLTEHLEENNQTAYEDWKSVVLKLSRKEPEVLLSLTQSVLEKMEEISWTMNYEQDNHLSPEYSAKFYRIELLSCLFEWLSGKLKTLKHVTQKESIGSTGSKTDKNLSKATVLGLLRRSLLISSLGNKHLMSSALALAQLTGDTSLLHKLRKLSSLKLSDSEANSVDFCSETILSEQEHSIREAEKKFELIRGSRLLHEKPKDPEMGTKSRWGVMNSWNPCPIGMLPHTLGFSGRLPVLDNVNNCTDSIEQCNTSLGKREAENDIDKMDNTPVKRMKETETDCVMQEDVNAEGIGNHLLIEEWKEVANEEVSAIESSVRLIA